MVWGTPAQPRHTHRLTGAKKWVLMKYQELHEWPLHQGDALAIQNRLKDRVRIEPPPEITFIAGVDTAFDHQANVLFAAACVFTYPELVECEQATADREVVFDYVPGLYAFREGPVILAALAKLRTRLDMVIFSGHGIAHPRRFGLASHLGLLLEVPAIGCARKRLAGQHDEVGPQRHDISPLILGNQHVGTVYRSREKVKPIFISPGHCCDIDGATEIVARCLREYRLPEPIRSAHRLANRMKRDYHTTESLIPR